jgi:hypothetical protein
MKTVLQLLGYLWSLLHTLVGVLLMVTVYFPKSVKWIDGALVVIVRWHIIPEGMDRTGDGDCDDPEDFITGAQTHGCIIFCRDEKQAASARLQNHERVHIAQSMVLGPLYPLLYGILCLVMLIKHRSTMKAYWMNPLEVQARAHEKELPWIFR